MRTNVLAHSFPLVERFQVFNQSWNTTNEAAGTIQPQNRWIPCILHRKPWSSCWFELMAGIQHVSCSRPPFGSCPPVWWHNSALVVTAVGGWMFCCLSRILQLEKTWSVAASKSFQAAMIPLIFVGIKPRCFREIRRVHLNCWALLFQKELHGCWEPATQHGLSSILVRSVQYMYCSGGKIKQHLRNFSPSPSKTWRFV